MDIMFVLYGSWYESCASSKASLSNVQNSMFAEAGEAGEMFHTFWAGIDEFWECLCSVWRFSLLLFLIFNLLISGQTFVAQQWCTPVGLIRKSVKLSRSEVVLSVVFFFPSLKEAAALRKRKWGWWENAFKLSFSSVRNTTLSLLPCEHTKQKSSSHWEDSGLLLARHSVFEFMSGRL